MPVPTLEQLDEALDKDPGNPAILHERGLWLLNVGTLNEHWSVSTLPSF